MPSFPAVRNRGKPKISRAIFRPNVGREPGRLLHNGDQERTDYLARMGARQISGMIAYKARVGRTIAYQEPSQCEISFTASKIYSDAQNFRTKN